MSNTMDERREKIELLIMRNDEMKVVDIAKSLNVTPETIRSDLDFLERKGILTRSHGKARLRVSTSETPMEIRMRENASIKRTLSEDAFQYIQDGMTIYLSAGSTLMYLVKMLALRKNLTVVTNSIDVVLELSSQSNKAILIGGAYNPVGRRMNGSLSIEMLKPFHFDLSVLGFDGSLNLDGPGSIDYEEMIVCDLVRKHSLLNILIGDHTKFEQTSYYECGKWDDYDVLITDRIPETMQEQINTKIIHKLG